MIAEHSQKRLYWDCLILTLILISCLLISYQFAFVHKPGFYWLIYLIDLFFLGDIVLNFRTTYRDQGVEIEDKSKISRRYKSTMFPIDILANVPFDLIVLIIAGDSQWLGISVVLWLQLLRMLRVIRLFLILFRLDSLFWTNPALLKITRFALIVGLLTHWVACFWFLTAFTAGFPQTSWAVKAGIESAAAIDQYVRSLYWAITTMTTVGFGDITPNRTPEYLVAMIVMVMGITMYAFIVGTISSLLSGLHATKSAYRERVESVAEYLRNSNVPPHLHDTVRNYYEYRWGRFGGLDQPSLLKDLPEPLRVEIMCHIAQDIIEHVPLFKHCSPALRNALVISLTPQTHPPNSIIARENEPGRQIYFITKGKAEILSINNGTHFGDLHEGDYFGHLSLVLGEQRTASVRAIDYCEALILSKETYDRLKEEYPEFLDVLKKVSAENTEKMSALMIDGVVL